MKKGILHLIMIGILFVSLTGCTKEKALALQAASLQLMLSTVKAVQSIEGFCAVMTPSVADLDGRTKDAQVTALSKSIVGGGTPISISVIKTKTKEINKELNSSCLKASYPKLNERLEALKSGTKALNDSLVDLHKGYLFSTDSVKALKTPLKILFSDLSNLAVNFKEIPVQNTNLNNHVAVIKNISKSDKDDQIKELSISNELRQIIQSQQSIESKRDEVVNSLLVASKFSKDILEHIDGWDKLSIQDILNIMNDWAPLADTLTGGHLSAKKTYELSKEIKDYAVKIGVLDTNLSPDVPLTPSALN